MHLSTLAVILTVWAGAVLAGAAGVVIAIPVAGCISVSMRHWREYREIERLLQMANGDPSLPTNVITAETPAERSDVDTVAR
jgi:predicted PurR-regulated permease PerM